MVTEATLAAEGGGFSLLNLNMSRFADKFNGQLENYSLVSETISGTPIVLQTNAKLLEKLGKRTEQKNSVGD